jgi:hypothetical protein
MSYYGCAPDSVSYEALLRVLQQRSTNDKPYDERLYLVELTNALWERVRQARKSSEHKKGFFDLEI